MQHWLQIATRSWRTRPARSILAVLSITLGVGVVVWVTCCYESVRRGMTEVVLQWIGRSHVIVEPSAGVWATFHEDLEEFITDNIDGVRHASTRTREYVEGAPLKGKDWTPIEIWGSNPEKESTFRSHKLVEGRFIRPGDDRTVVIEQYMAEEFKVAVGGVIRVRQKAPPYEPEQFTVVGIMDRRRASGSQAMMAWTALRNVQSLVRLPQQVKAVDIIVADPSVANIQRIATEVRGLLDRRHAEQVEAGTSPTPLEVKTTEAQHKKLGAAQGLLHFIMMLLSCVVLMTAFFIILATMSMGVTERITELGLLRCIGVTRPQLGGLIMLQTIPLGVIGTLVGVPLGLALQWITIQFVPDYLGELAFNTWGIALAVGGGIGTTVLGAAAPAMRAFKVSPVEATRTAGAAQLARWVWIATALGVAALAAHFWVSRAIQNPASGRFEAQAIASLVLLYCGAALLVPFVVVSLGRIFVHVAARILWLRPQLLGDEIGKAPFRSASICCGLMVGLSLIVGLVVWGQSVKKGWEFPKEFPDALLYTYRSQPLDRVKALKDIEGVKQLTVTDDFSFLLRDPEKKSFLSVLAGLSLQEKFQRCLAIDPDESFEIVRLMFLEGNEKDALAKMKEGGHLLVTREFSKANDKHLGDRVTLWAAGRPGKYKKARFKIAGVIASPGLDIAISFFNATTHFQTYSVGAIMCSQADAKKLFDREYGKLILFNFDLEGDSTPVSAEPGQMRPIVTAVNEEGRPTFASTGGGPIAGKGPEVDVVNRMLEKLGFPERAFVTARQLKQQIDGKITRVTLLLSTIPFVGLLIAALGLGNLMAANVASRSKHLAVLRAIGVTKNQLSRMVIGEALVLALIGSGMGLLLGMVLGRTSNVMTELLSGFRPTFSIPWEYVTPGALLATLLCVIAALIPARYASRSNIVAALSDL